MVIAGSLVVGSSVRGTLERKVHERLGDTETVVFANGVFLDSAFVHNPVFDNSAEGVLMTKGFVAQGGRLIPVNVWGKSSLNLPKGNLGDAQTAFQSEGRGAFNSKLAKELALTVGEDFVLRLPSMGFAPSGSLFVSDNYTTSLRLSYAGEIAVENGGNLALSNEQTVALNVFVNREELAEAMEIEGKINVIFSSKKIEKNAVFDALTPNVLGIKVESQQSAVSSQQLSFDFRFSTIYEITLDRIFIPTQLTDAICEAYPSANRLFSYLVNEISMEGRLSLPPLEEAEGRSIPYSFVTAIERYAGDTLHHGEIILSDYAAKRLHAKRGDRLTLSFFTLRDALKTMHEEQETFVVKKIIPLSVFAADSALSANFPGLSNVENCTDWDSDIPIDMNRITQEDEDYWDTYKNTPKALVAYSSVVDKWSNNYGNATAVRIEEKAEAFSSLLWRKVGAEVFGEGLGLRLIYPRENALLAAKSGVDFASLFLSLGFFIVIAALLLSVIPVYHLLFSRKKESELLRNMGYNSKRLFRMYFREIIPIVLWASLCGVVFAVVYSQIVLWLLGSVWNGATHADGFSLYFNFSSLFAGSLAGFFITLLVIFIVLKRNVTQKFKNSKIQKSPCGKRAGFQIPQFSPDTFSVWKRTWATLNFDRKGTILSFLCLTIGVFLVFAVGLNRQGLPDNAADLQKKTGGYAFWGESSVPVYHDLSSEEGRAKLGLKNLPEGTEIIQLLRHKADDASCLNLNKPVFPTILGIDSRKIFANFPLIPSKEMDCGKHKLSNNLESFCLDSLISYGEGSEVSYPVVADAAVIQWSLQKSLGDTLSLSFGEGRGEVLQLVAALPNTIFQGNLLMDKHLFIKLFPEQQGSEVMLVKCVPDTELEVREILEKSLYNYGLLLTPMPQRLAEFNSVSNTYMSIFLTLGSIGLLLGLVSFVIVVRKNLAMRSYEITLYKTLGFPARRIKRLLFVENLLIPLAAIAVGLLAAVIVI